MKTKRQMRKAEIISKGKWCHRKCRFLHQPEMERAICYLFFHNLLADKTENKIKNVTFGANIGFIRCPPCLRGRGYENNL